MTILLYKDGRLIVDDGNPLEGVSLDGLVACVSDPADGDTLVYDASAGMWKAGKGGGSGSGNVLIVGTTVSETAATMDKTFNEIKNADGAFVKVGPSLNPITLINEVIEENIYNIEVAYYDVVDSTATVSIVRFVAESADDYPSLALG